LSETKGIAERLRAEAGSAEFSAIGARKALREAAARIEALEREVAERNDDAAAAKALSADVFELSDKLSAAEAQVVRLTEALTDIADHVPVSFDFSAPSDGFEFCKRRARSAIGSDNERGDAE
jgi:uncharacterized coiled-coil protein SlyX